MVNLLEIGKEIPRYETSVEYTVQGNYAMFSRPWSKESGEKHTFKIPTYEALRGITSSIYWKPAFDWIIDAVRIMKPIQTEVKGVLTFNNEGLYNYTYLKDCEYQVLAHFEFNRDHPDGYNVKKHLEIAQRAIEKGGRRDIYLGTRECQGYVLPSKFGEGDGFYDRVPHDNYGTIYHGITYPEHSCKKTKELRFAEIEVNYGIIRFPHPEDNGIKSVKVSSEES